MLAQRCARGRPWWDVPGFSSVDRDDRRRPANLNVCINMKGSREAGAVLSSPDTMMSYDDKYAPSGGAGQRLHSGRCGPGLAPDTRHDIHTDGTAHSAAHRRDLRSIGRAIGGGTGGGFFVSIAVGFVGALLGIILGQRLGLPDFLVVTVDRHPFPSSGQSSEQRWSVALVHLFSGRRIRPLRLYQSSRSPPLLRTSQGPEHW